MNKCSLIRTVTVSVFGLSMVVLSACESSTTVDAPTIASATHAVATPSNQTLEAPIDLATLTMTVYKSPTCGCCKAWVDYMQAEGFSAIAVETDDVDSIKAQHGLTSPELKSCHTAVIDGYVIEGHVPANDVRQLLAERPDIVGLTAPGMPMMSPGMGSLTPEDYDVLAFDENGRTRIWSAY